MADLKTRWQVKIETLSPLHIGSGMQLLLDYDVVPHDDQTYRVNEGAFFSDKLAQAEAQGANAVQRLLTGRPASELLDDQDYKREHLFRYRMPGKPFTTTSGATVQEQIKDAYDRLYLPGSSLKGALRTILFWGIYVREDRQVDWTRLRDRRSRAAQDLERDVFGPDANHDWLRALRVTDSGPLEAPGRGLRLRTMLVYPTETAESPGLRIDVESVDPGVAFEGAITVDEYSFRGEAADELGWRGKRAWLFRLTALARERARERLQDESAFFLRGPASARRFIADLQARLSGLGEDEFIMQIGWGTRWESKTVGSSLLRDDTATFERLLRRYNMTKERRRRPGDPFPKTRTLAPDGAGGLVSMGWVRVRLVGYEPGPPPAGEGAQPPREERPRRPQDLRPGMVLTGTVRAIRDFGAFVDVGVGRDGLLRSSELVGESGRRVEDVLRVGQRVRVKVLRVELRDNWRIGLTMRGLD